MSSYKGPRASAKASTSASRTSTQETKSSGGNDLPNADGKSKSNSSRQPDLSKYAKYLQEDSVKFDETRYKPTIHAERPQVGVSLNQRRNRANGETASGASEEPGRRRPTQRAHIRAYSLNRTGTNSDGSSRLSNLQNGTDGRPRSYYGEDLFMKSRISKPDTLDEEQAGTQSKAGFSSDAYKTNERNVENKDTTKPYSTKTSVGSSSKERFSSFSSSNGDNKDSSKPISTKETGGTSTRTSRSGRTLPGEDSEDRFRSRTKTKTDNSIPATDYRKTKTSHAATAKEPGKKFFQTIDDIYAPGDDREQLSSTPRASANTSNAFKGESSRGKPEPRKTFLSPETSWNSKYFPSPYEHHDDKTDHFGNTASCRTSPIRQDREETEKEDVQFTPKFSSRNGLLDHLRSQESRRSHSLDSRNRTSNRESSDYSSTPKKKKVPTATLR